MARGVNASRPCHPYLLRWPLVDRLAGAPYNPLSAPEVEEKFLMLSTAVLGDRQSKSIVETCRQIENVTDRSTLGALLN
ncbi:MAG: hypothetical protein ACREQW_10990 [Candidatus Binatia bacterium]